MEQYNYYRAVEHDVLSYLENDGWFSCPSVINPFGEVIPANVAVQLMDDDLREALLL